MTRFGQFLKQLIDASPLNEAQIAKRMKIKSRGYLSGVESGVTLPPTPERCKQIADILELSNQDREALIHLAALERAGEEFKPYVERALASGSKVIAFSSRPDDYVKVPLLGECPASHKKWVSDEVETWHFFPSEIARGRKLYLLRVLGDSMDRSGMCDGDLILVDAEAAPSSGDAVVIRVDDECTVKRYYKDGNQVTLTPDSTNSTHRPMVIDVKRSEVLLRGVVDSIYMKKLRREK